MNEYIKTKIIELKTTLKNNPQDTTIILKLGNIYFLNGNYEEATIYYEDYLSKNPTFNGDIYLNLLISSCYIHSPKDAFKYLKIVIANQEYIKVNPIKLYILKDLVFHLLNYRLNELSIALSKLLSFYIKKPDIDGFYAKCMFASERARNYELALYFAELNAHNNPTFKNELVYFQDIKNLTKPNIIIDLNMSKEDILKALKASSLTPKDYLHNLLFVIKSYREEGNYSKARYFLSLYLNLNYELNNNFKRTLKK